MLILTGLSRTASLRRWHWNRDLNEIGEAIMWLCHALCEWVLLWCLLAESFWFLVTVLYMDTKLFIFLWLSIPTRFYSTGRKCLCFLCPLNILHWLHGSHYYLSTSGWFLVSSSSELGIRSKRHAEAPTIGK
jgi:hypothetical protein